MLKTYRELLDEVVQTGQWQTVATAVYVTDTADRLRRVSEGVALKEERIEKARRNMENEFEMAFYAR